MGRLRYFLVIAVLFAACGETTIDAAELESEIARGVESQTATRDVEAECPDDVKAEEGDTFECDVKAPGGVEAKVTVRQTDDDGNVRWRLRP